MIQLVKEGAQYTTYCARRSLQARDRAKDILSGSKDPRVGRDDLTWPDVAKTGVSDDGQQRYYDLEYLYEDANLHHNERLKSAMAGKLLQASARFEDLRSRAVEALGEDFFTQDQWHELSRPSDFWQNPRFITTIRRQDTSDNMDGGSGIDDDDASNEDSDGDSDGDDEDADDQEDEVEEQEQEPDE